MKLRLGLATVGSVSFSMMLLASAPCSAGRPFTVTDEIGLTLLGDPDGGSPQVRFSPDGKYFAVWTERGNLDLNLVEDALSFYRSQDVEEFLKNSDQLQPPSPIWVVYRSGKEGPIISTWRWLANSSGVAFLEVRGRRVNRLVLADFRKKMLRPLTLETESAETFDIKNRRNYVYTAVGASERVKRQDERRGAAIVGTGRPLYELIFPDDPVYRRRSNRRDRNLWAVVDGKRFEVKHEGAPIVPDGDLALSPDGTSVVAQLLVPAPPSWETLYPPPYDSIPFRVRGRKTVDEYVQITLLTGTVQALTDAPISIAAGWESYGSPSWSNDGQAILLPGTFLSSKDQAPSWPCVAVVDLPSNTRTCVEPLKAYTKKGWKEGDNWVLSERFANGDKQRVMVSTHNRHDGALETTEYRRTVGSTWQVAGHIKAAHEVGGENLRVSVDQWFDKPPRLVGTSKGASRIILDPNPQLKDIELGQASTYEWKDREGRKWGGGLFKPTNYKAGQRYPLVIQTHGFAESEFRPSGVFPTAFAARALAAVGIVVLQAESENPCSTGALDEGPCAASGYESAAEQLVSEELADPEAIGIIGFSRTCFYVMQTLTMSSLRVRAASITDGVMGGYLEYILAADDRIGSDFNSLIGARPFAEGLQDWLKRSPEFNLDKVRTPLLVVGEGPYSLLFMWEPYAGLRYLHKPVDLIVLNTDEHVLTNPAVRMASQGGSVDWFRFWLQGYEDPAIEKVDQYRRWERLCDLQREQNPNQPAFCVRTKSH